MIRATRDALACLANGETPVMFAPFPGPLEDAVIYDRMVWKQIEADYPELFAQDDEATV